MSLLSKKNLRTLWSDYFHAKERAHHHTMMVLGGLIIAGTMLSWQTTNFLNGATHADWTPTWCQDNSGSIQVPEDECDTLLDFYISTNGDNWDNSQKNDRKWFQGNGSDMCNGAWYGLGCSRDMGDGKYHVQSINFERQGNGLSGIVATSLYTLPMLNSLYLSHNPNMAINIDDITQSVYASNYTNINVNNAILHGNLNGFANLTNLQYLDVACYRDTNYDNCGITGDTSFVPSLHKLYGLLIGGHTGVTFDLNDLSGSDQITDIFALNNYIVGDIDVLAGNTGMTRLDLGCWDLLDGQCNVSGHMSTLQNMPNLNSVSFDGLFNIVGTLDPLSDKNQLQYADFSHNPGLVGTLDPIKNLSGMFDFDVDDTSIGGSLPIELESWRQVQDLNLSNNLLSGALIDFSKLGKLQGLHLGSNNLDYSNLWDMLLGDDLPPPPACVPTPAKPCTGKPFHSSLTQLELNRTNIGGTIPDIRDKFPSLQELDMQFNKFTGPIPPSFGSLSKLQKLSLIFNNLEGPIPTFLTNLDLQNGNKLKLESNCLDTDVSDPGLLSLLQNHAKGWNNQMNCRSNIQVSTSLDSQLVPGSCSTYTIAYENLGPQKAINVKLGQVFNGLVVSGSNPAYTGGMVGRTYGTTGDSCYVDGTQNGTGPYYTWFENLLQANYQIPSLYALAVNQGGFTGAQGTTELGFILDQFCPMIFGTSDRSLCFLLFGSSMADIDPSCGEGGEAGYLWNLDTIPAGGSGSIDVNLCVPQDASGSVSVSSKVSTISTNESSGSNDQQFQFTIQNNGSGGNQTGNNGNTGDNGNTIQCGNNIIDIGEQCDDGNNNNGDGCDSVCKIESSSNHSSNKNSSSPTYLTKDKCLPNPPGDLSPSYYDGSCVDSGHNSADTASGDNLFDPMVFLPDLMDVKDYLSSMPSTISVDVEQIRAFLFAKRAKLTSMMDYGSFAPEEALTRATWAKFLVAFMENILQREPNQDRLKVCAHAYSDVGSDLGDLKDYIIKACMFPVMGLQNDGITPLDAFNPHASLTRAEVSTTLSRMIWGTKNDGAFPYRAKHMVALHDAGIIRNTTPDIVESRINAITMLMRAMEIYDQLFK